MKFKIALIVAVSGILAGQQSPDLSSFGRGEGKYRPGDPAPDFRLKRLHSSDEVALSSFRGKKPVALVFGSYT
jgi:hypothetical protein